MTIIMVRVEEKPDCTDRVVPFQTTSQQTTNLDPGIKKVLQAGQTGSERVCFNVHYEDGVETNRTPSSTTLITPPTDEIVAIGIDNSKLEPLPITGVILYLSSGQ